MTRGAIGSICLRTTLRISRCARGIRWRSRVVQNVGLRPGTDPIHQRVDLLVGEHPSRTLRKRRHRYAEYSACDSAANHAIVSDCKKNGIAQSDRRSTLSARTMASCAVLRVEQTELHDLARRDNFGVRFGPAR